MNFAVEADNGQKRLFASDRYREYRRTNPGQYLHMLSDLDDSQRALAESMGWLSEASYHAGWMDGLEFDLWRGVVEEPFRYGQLDLNVDHIARLQRLSEACGGWIVFDGDREETFVPIDYWKIIYRDRTHQ